MVGPSPRIAGVQGTEGVAELPRPLRCRLPTRTGADGFDPEPGTVRHGSNSGHQAVHLAAQLGAKTIIIVGMDFTDKDFARDHWFGRHQGRMDMCSDTETWRKHFRVLTDALEARGVTVLNASLSSTIKWLPTVSLESAL
jgi:hypothetical protein